MHTCILPCDWVKTESITSKAPGTMHYETHFACSRCGSRRKKTDTVYWDENVSKGPNIKFLIQEGIKKKS